MVNELYIFLKKKIKKYTTEELNQQLDVKNFKNQIIFLKQKEKILSSFKV